MIDQPLTVAAIRPPLVTERRQQEPVPTPVLAVTRLGTTVARVWHVDNGHGRG